MSFLFRRGNTNLYSWPVRADYSQELFIAFQRELHLHFVDGASSQRFSVFHHFIDQLMAMDVSVLHHFIDQFMAMGVSVLHHFIDQFMAMGVSVLHHFIDQFMLTILLVQILACSSC